MRVSFPDKEKTNPPVGRVGKKESENTASAVTDRESLPPQDLCDESQELAQADGDLATDTPDQQSEDAKSSGKKQDRENVPKTSGENPKKLTKDLFERLQAVYNANKPDSWAECQKYNPKRRDLADRLYQDCGRDIAECEVALLQALAYAKLDPFWSGQKAGKRGSTFHGRFDSVFEDRRYQVWAEMLAAKGLTSEQVHSKGPVRASPADAEIMRIYEKTLRAIGHVA